ncbi:hypothetical protein [Corynebacterium gottingense]|uniref:Uncharacterized protein n=1 Tax=Corynebacterium gottingense TaxID=2041036 RepID=A0ABX9UJP4_9CORY|nr:hypothetical protein [Corynebacterium gottingense]RMD19678.1 hypothetical protein EAW56_06030 [Corynebacterium gottingense]WJZ12952.1 hypothetical protein CGOTT_05045 [Corynebacterium gottingense]WJZ15277.1 hypothetical protein CGOTTB_05065 [Corynebacterium gottingense]
MILLIAFVIALLAWETFRAARRPQRRGFALANATLTALVVWWIATPLDWNATLPIWLWWALAVWAAVLVGLSAARLALQRSTVLER